MEIFYINLPARSDRNERFLRDNAGIASFRRADAVIGSNVSVEELVRNGIAAEPLPPFTPGAFGNVFSHRRLWQHCVGTNAVLTLAEDDATFNRHFRSKASRILAELPLGWDIILWGWNFDSILHVKILGEIHQALMTFDQRPLGPRVAEFHFLDYPVAPLRLINAFGLVSYSLSPAGAWRLLELCFPLRDESVAVPGLKFPVLNTALDITMNKHYGALQAYACFPPLVWTENDHTSSDVVGRAVVEDRSAPPT